MNIFIKTKKCPKNTLTLIKSCPRFWEYNKDCNTDITGYPYCFESDNMIIELDKDQDYDTRIPFYTFSIVFL